MLFSYVNSWSWHHPVGCHYCPWSAICRHAVESVAVSGVEGAIVAGFRHRIVPLNDPLIFTRHSWRAILAVSQAGVSSVICENAKKGVIHFKQWLIAWLPGRENYGYGVLQSSTLDWFVASHPPLSPWSSQPQSMLLCLFHCVGPWSLRWIFADFDTCAATFSMVMAFLADYYFTDPNNSLYTMMSLRGVGVSGLEAFNSFTHKAQELAPAK